MSVNYFTPVSGLLGGSLIGLSAATLLIFNGDILGASGLMSSFVVAPKKTLTDPSQHWKLAFVAAFSLTTRMLIGRDELSDESQGYYFGLPMVSPLGFIAGGFLVGFGTKLGNGCTTGHGICGLARRSTRSLAAVLSFMAAGVLSATACSPTCPFYPYFRESLETIAGHKPTVSNKAIGTAIAALASALTLPGLLRRTPKNLDAKESDEIIQVNNKRKVIPAIVSGAIFSLGLKISGMTVSSKINGFLNVKGIKNGSWDPTLACVMGGGLIVSFVSYQWVKGFNIVKNDKALECPLSQKSSGGNFNIPTNSVIDSKLLIGEVMFGLGWGIAGLCPGPAMFLACAGNQNVLFGWLPSFFIGSLLAETIKLL
ncbi:hypothetical protein ACHAXA_010426 [Cyclostephanos tholiformis]|uniref:Sulphur transport domain-containing protein n=1 Tax=Cyclostephanos tholiformis TaxID=382380 RepID=A0ABD3R250_9STRA